MISCIEADIYRRSYDGVPCDCSNHGISTRFNTVLVPAEGGHIKVDDENPPENFCMADSILGVYHLTPAHLVRAKKHPMHGGTFAYSCDSRFPFKYPVMIFDRVEK